MDAKEKKRESNRLYYQANKEKLKLKQTAYYQAKKEEVKAKSAAYQAANAEIIKVRNAAYRAAHTEEVKAKSAAYYQANAEKIKAKNAAHRKEHHREIIIYSWKHAGMMLRPDESWNAVYAKYATTTHCESCEVELDDSSHNTHRCHDHSHEGDCYIRGTVCQLCNSHDNWKKRMTPDSIYQKY